MFFRVQPILCKDSANERIFKGKKVKRVKSKKGKSGKCVCGCVRRNSAASLILKKVKSKKSAVRVLLEHELLIFKEHMCFMFLIKKQGLEVIKIRAIRVGHNASRFYLAILPSNLSISKWSILFAVLDILVCRTDDATALEVELFYAMGCPTNDTCHSKYRSIDFLWQTNHLIDET